MFGNYLKIAVRNIIKQKIYSLIAVVGLAIGLACFALAVVYSQYEFSFDTFHDDYQRTYLIGNKNVKQGIFEQYYPVTPGLMKSWIEGTLPEAEAVSVCEKCGFGADILLQYENKGFYKDGYFVDENFLKIFNFPFIQGDPVAALSEPNSIVITRELAELYFGEKDPLGQTMIYKEEQTFKITGVIENLPENTHFQFDYLVSFITYANTESGKNMMKCTACNSFYTYLKLKSDINPDDFENKLAGVLTNKVKPGSNYILFPVKDLRLKSVFSYYPRFSSDIKYIYIIFSIAIVFLILGCLNYINLSTAWALNRAKEVGIRKVVGALKRQLIKQFIIESVILVFISLVISLIILELILPAFNSLLNINLKSEMLFNLQFISILLGITLIIGVVAGGYPAVFLSSLKPLRVIKKFQYSGREGAIIRKIFAVLQFSMAIALLIITLLINNQLHFVSNKDLGYSKDNILIVPINGEAAKQNCGIIKRELLQNPKIEKVAICENLPCAVKSSTYADIETEASEMIEIGINILNTEYDYLDLFDIDMVKGRNYSPDYNDTQGNAVILNEAAVRKLGWKEPLGKSYKMWGWIDAKVIGIVEDFHFESLYKKIEPLALMIKNYENEDAMFGFNNYLLAVKTLEDADQDLISSIKNIVTGHITDHPFGYYALNDYYNNLYKSEANIGKSFSYVSVMAIIVACLGLFALASLDAGRRTKEIGIRKVLGA